MQRVAHGVAYFSPDVEPQILRLMKLQCSAVRSAYQAKHKHNLKDNDIKVYVKKDYSKDLNVRYISDACSHAAQVTQEDAIFGGQKAWEKLQSGALSKEDWQTKRNNQIYSRGDESHGGNPNIRIEGERILINDPSGRGLWLEGKLFLPSKWTPDLTCYSVQVLHRGSKFEVKVSWEEQTPPITTDKSRGVLAVDTNPNGLGIARLAPDGNLLGHQFKMKERIPFAKKDKRSNDVRVLAKEVVMEAKAKGIPIALENLNFKPENRSKGSRKFRRMKSNFQFRSILDAIHSRALHQGVEVIDVAAAYTSILGTLRYEKTFSLNRHTAAAIIIGRRALGFLERPSFSITGTTRVKHPDTTKVVKGKTVTRKGRTEVLLNLEGGGRTLTVAKKTYSWLWRGPFLKSKNSFPHRNSLGPEMIVSSGIDGSLGGIPKSEPFPITGPGTSECAKRSVRGMK